MQLTNLISDNFVVLPGQWYGSKARELIRKYPSITHVIVADEPLARVHRARHATVQAGELKSGNLVLEIPFANIEVTGRNWNRIRISPRRFLYVTSRDELAELDEQEEEILSRLVHLRGWREAPLIASSTDPEMAPDLSVVFDKSRLRGIFDVKIPPRSIHVGNVRFHLHNPGVRPLENTPPAPPSRGHGDGPPPESFNAYPRLDAPAQLVPEEEFTVIVGFRPDADPALQGAQALHIENPPPDATITVLFNAVGAKVLGPRQHQLALDMAAHAEIRCSVTAGIQEVTLLVDYLYESQLIGHAQRQIAVMVPGAPTPAPKEEEGAPARLGTPTAASAVDLTVTITSLPGGRLEWRFFAPSVPKKSDPIETQLSNARDFATSVLKQLNAEQKGLFGARTIDSLGTQIGDAMPKEFCALLRQVHAVVKRRPIVLLHTDEMYVPWELATIDPPLSVDYGPSMLGAQTVVGRWFRDQNVPLPPPHEVCLRSVSVVASAYGQGTGQAALAEALVEKEHLTAALTGYGLSVTAHEATRADLEALLEREVTPGGAIHFAVHGYSDPDANEQMLFLADRKSISPGALAGGRKQGEPPRFEFVFINACQVGTAGQALGQAAGFPGALIRAGANAFLAPLWNVHDGTARLIAEDFYEQTLHAGVTVAEFFAQRRASYDRKETTTPLAYIFYGHPRLKFRTIEVLL